MSFPLALLPTIPDNLELMDSRIALRHLMAFMKNALIRGLNTIYRVAPLINSLHTAFASFLEYVEHIFVLLRLHLENEQEFLSAPCIRLHIEDRLGGSCNSPAGHINDVHKILEAVHHWSQNPSSYSATLLRDSLQFLPRMVSKMDMVLRGIENDTLSTVISQLDLRRMIEDNMHQFAARSDISFLLPFVISHHDPSTSSYWPTVTEQGLAALPELVQKHSQSWQFAPIDPLSRKFTLWSP